MLAFLLDIVEVPEVSFIYISDLAPTYDIRVTHRGCSRECISRVIGALWTGGKGNSVYLCFLHIVLIAAIRSTP